MGFHNTSCTCIHIQCTCGVASISLIISVNLSLFRASRVCAYVCTHACVCVCTCVRACVRAFLHAYVCACVHTCISYMTLINWGAWDVWSSAPQLMSCNWFVCPFIIRLPYDHLHLSHSWKTLVARQLQTNVCMCVCTYVNSCVCVCVCVCECA